MKKNDNDQNFLFSFQTTFEVEHEKNNGFNSKEKKEDIKNNQNEKINNSRNIKKEIEELRLLIKKANISYYIENKPIMSDIEYDRLFDKLKKLEKEYPEYDDDNSPTKIVGSDIDNKFPEINHKFPILSLDKCYSSMELLNWMQKIILEYKDVDFTFEPKIDGASVVLYYNEGKLQYCLTRGNGYVGNDITENIKTIKSVPVEINYKREIAVRGEVFIEKEDFFYFNENFANNLYSNPRNLASGALRRVKPKETALFPLKLYVYEVYTNEEIFKYHHQNINFLIENGFPVIDRFAFFSNDKKVSLMVDNFFCGKFSEIEEYIDNYKKVRNSLKYEIDGIVIKVDNINIRNEMGYTSHHPKWAIAYKFESPLASTVIKDINIQIGRGGRVTPVAILEPVELSGSVISRATLHNQDYINSLDINIGDIVNISKRGDVIPAVEEVIEKRSVGSYKIGEFCPYCNSRLYQDGSHLFCKNEKCEKKKLETLKYFVSRDCMDINTLGDKTIEFLFVNQFITDIPSIYTFDYYRLLDYDGFGQKKIESIFENLEVSKNKPFRVVLYSLGFKDIGEKMAGILVDNFKNIDNIIELARKNDIEKLLNINGIGEKLALSIIETFKNSENIELIEKLRKIGLKFEDENDQEEGKNNLFLKGTKWVITGSFDNFKPRDKAEELIKKYGGEVLSAVSKNVNYLLCGFDAGSKKEKAEKFGVKIINEKEFIDLFKENGIVIV